MYKFNEETIAVGYIKQLLHSFNLPKCKLFKSTDEAINYYKNLSSVALIKNYKNNNYYLVWINNGKIEKEKSYSYNHEYLNITGKMNLFNGLYDSRTHIYLGNYLRFLRDYNNINLMSLYNCYADITFTDTKYKYISIPVKYNQTYTVAFTGTNYDYYLGFEDDLKSIQKYFAAEKNKNSIIRKTSEFNNPFKLSTKAVKNKYFMEENYKLILRVPLNNNNKIVVLEGDYRGSTYKNIVDIAENKKDINTIIDSKSIYIQANYDDVNDVNLNNYINNLYLLKNNYKNYSEPFSPRLIEYLIENTITSDEKISKNVIDAKYKLFTRYGSEQQKKDVKSGLFKLNDKINTEYRLRFLDCFKKANKPILDDTDLLGYVDKDIEYCLDDETRGN